MGFFGDAVARKPFRLFTFFQTLRNYRRSDLGGDVKGAFNCALLAFPQGMAYALIAGVPIEYGIFGSAVAAILGGLFAGSRFITLGPTNATSVMLASAFAGVGIADPELRAQLMPTMLLMVGFFLVAGAFLRVAGFIQYISRTVVTGYITAAALFIIVGQFPKVLGFDIDPNASTMVEKVFQIALHLPDIQLESLTMAIGTAGLFYFLQSMRWTRGLPNVAITLLVLSVIAAFASQMGILFGFWDPGDLDFLNSVNAAEWPRGIPVIDLKTFGDLSNGALAVALLCVLEGTSIGKSLAARSGERLNTNQEMYAIGMSNLGCAFAGGMPASGSLTRSQLTWSSGAKTPMASLINGCIVAVGAFAVGPLIQFIPKSVLAMLVITIGLSLFNRRAIRVAFASTSGDRIVFLTTCFGGLVFPLDTAIYLGTGLSIILFLRQAATPELIEYSFSGDGDLLRASMEKAPVDRGIPEVSIIHAEGDLFFGSAEIFHDQMRRVADDPNLKIVICKMRNARHMDATSAMAIEELVKYMNENGRYLILSEVRPDILAVLRDSGVLTLLNGENGEPFVFDDTPDNPTISTAKALKRAKELLGGGEAEIRIYVNPAKRSD